jgi:hypothetical protein
MDRNARRVQILSSRIFPQHKAILQDPTSFSSKNEDYRNNDQDIMEISTSLVNTEK